MEGLTSNTMIVEGQQTNISRVTRASQGRRESSTPTHRLHETQKRHGDAAASIVRQEASEVFMIGMFAGNHTYTVWSFSSVAGIPGLVLSGVRLSLERLIAVRTSQGCFCRRCLKNGFMAVFPSFVGSGRALNSCLWMRMDPSTVALKVLSTLCEFRRK